MGGVGPFHLFVHLFVTACLFPLGQGRLQLQHLESGGWLHIWQRVLTARPGGLGCPWELPHRPTIAWAPPIPLHPAPETLLRGSSYPSVNYGVRGLSRAGRRMGGSIGEACLGAAGPPLGCPSPSAHHSPHPPLGSRSLPCALQLFA